MQQLDKKLLTRTSAFEKNPRLVICDRPTRGQRPASTHRGVVLHKPVTPSKLKRALNQIWQDSASDTSVAGSLVVDPTFADPLTRITDSGMEAVMQPPSQPTQASLQRRQSSRGAEHYSTAAACLRDVLASATNATDDQMPQSATSASSAAPLLEPSVLSVDDNDVNLRILVRVPLCPVIPKLVVTNHSMNCRPCTWSAARFSCSTFELKQLTA